LYRKKGGCTGGCTEKGVGCTGRFFENAFMAPIRFGLLWWCIWRGDTAHIFAQTRKKTKKHKKVVLVENIQKCYGIIRRGPGTTYKYILLIYYKVFK